ncbi:Mediator of RNA polymerase II transcription subunit 6 [Agyrium rufum]|nr:Mediator of RNA polymerase II transcription subunit 6 [Agyrium rufum]
MLYIIQTRDAFEGRLRSMAGLEYVVSHDPSDNGSRHENSGVWVIRKQNRRKRQGQADEIIPLSSYFVVGENIYMAPTVRNVLNSRLLSTVTSLNKLYSIAATLPLFSPASGHTYFPPSTKVTAGTGDKSIQTSREGTPLPGSQASVKGPKAPGPSGRTPSSEAQNANLLADSLRLSLRYGTEYMDENTLSGEPGSFVIQRSRPVQGTLTEQLTKPDGGAARAASTQPPLQSTNTKSRGILAPAPLKTEMSPDPILKGVRSGEKTPITPIFRDKKGRKKSKVAVATPK